MGNYVFFRKGHGRYELKNVIKVKKKLYPTTGTTKKSQLCTYGGGKESLHPKTQYRTTWVGQKTVDWGEGPLLLFCANLLQGRIGQTYCPPPPLGRGRGVRKQQVHGVVKKAVSWKKGSFPQRVFSLFLFKSRESRRLRHPISIIIHRHLSA